MGQPSAQQSVPSRDQISLTVREAMPHRVLDLRPQEFDLLVSCDAKGRPAKGGLVLMRVTYIANVLS